MRADLTTAPIVTVCAWCRPPKRLRVDTNAQIALWRETGTLVVPSSRISHGICPECMERALSDAK